MYQKSYTTCGVQVNVAIGKLEMNDYRGIIDALVKTYRYEGLKGLYRGFLPGVLGVSHTAVQFMVYDEMKNAYHRYYNMPLDSRMV